MKKVYLLIVICLVGLVMPQSIWAAATVTVSGTTVTIKTEKAGDLQTYLQAASDADKLAISSAETIVFDGKFNSSDLQALKDAGCCTQKTVDMSKAKFVSASSVYRLFSSENEKNIYSGQLNTGDQAIVGGVLYKSTAIHTYEWQRVTDQDEINNIDTYESYDPSWTEENLNTEHTQDKQVGQYIKFSSYNYYQKRNFEWQLVTNQDEINNINPNNLRDHYGWIDGQFTAANEEQHSVGDFIRFAQTNEYAYYKVVLNPNTYQWEFQLVTDNDEISSNDFAEASIPVSEANASNYSNGNHYVKFPVNFNYYKKINNPRYVPITNVSEVTNPRDPSFTEENMNNSENLNAYSNNEYIRFATEDHVYKKVELAQSYGWIAQDYSEGDEKLISYIEGTEEELQAITPTKEDLYAVVVDKSSTYEYSYDGSQWVEGAGNTEVDNYAQMKFDYWKDTVEEIITSKYATGPMAEQLCTDCTKLKTLTLNAGDFALGHTVLGNHINSLETVNINEDVTTLSAGMFNGISTLKTVNFDDDCKITVLPNAVFRETGITSLKIPSSVELIETEAFHTCQSLETVTFVNTNPNPLVIKNNAFQQSDHIKDIYLNVNPAERKLICEYNAFDYHSMEGQTAEGSEMATLHFAEENFDYYAGAWKKGMAFDQSGLNGIKDGVSNAGGNYIAAPTQSENDITGGYAQIDNNSDGFYHPSDNTKEYAPANGWQQFATTASPREVVFKGYVYMTYSTAKACSLPKGLIPFRVTDYKEAKTGANGKTIKGRLVLKMIDQVPTETGVLLISTNKYVVTDETSISKIYLGDPIGTPTPFPHEEINTDKLNYLVPAVSGVKVGPVSKGPYSGNNSFELKGTSDFDHRNFIMRKDTHQFVRTQYGTMANNRAFLSLPTDMFTNDNESDIEGPNPWNTQAGDAFNTYDETSTDPYSNTGNAKTTLFFEYDVEKYGMIWPLAQKEDVTDGIDEVVSHSNAERVQQGIFTLQGVKVDSPTTKGIYIVNGKKVIIK
ncbi:MAG: leucine-rich repeat protein [Prevotella sp.]|nr:leucine-rich repeat protein [Prevotella sp.]